MRRLLWVAVALAGLVGVVHASRALAFRARGFDPGRAALDSDCDQCVLVETLEVLPWIAVACGAYLVVVIGVGLASARRQQR